MSSPLVVSSGLSKQFGQRLVVDNVSFSINRGEVFGLLGPNGSGKSTILRMLVGCLRPSSGTATVAGFNVISDGCAARAQLGYAPEDLPIYASMRVEEFLSMMAQLKGVPAKRLDCALEKVCAVLDLNGILRRRTGQLSRGFRQRVNIAQALLNDPPLLIFDEPTNGLDPRQIIDCRKLILKLARNHAVLVTSHILSEVEKIADRAAFLSDGRLLGVDTVRKNDVVIADLESRFLELTDTA